MREGLGEAQDSSDELGSRLGFLCIVVWGSERGGKLPEKKLQNLLQAIFDDLAAEPSYYITRVQTFEEARVLTEDRGFVVTMAMAPSIKLLSLRAGELERTRGGL